MKLCAIRTRKSSPERMTAFIGTDRTIRRPNFEKNVRILRVGWSSVFQVSLNRISNTVGHRQSNSNARFLLIQTNRAVFPVNIREVKFRNVAAAETHP